MFTRSNDERRYLRNYWTDLHQFFRFGKGLMTSELKPFCDRLRDVAMATNFLDRIGIFSDMPSFVVLAFRNGLDYWNVYDKQARSALNMASLCKNLAMFGAVTPEIHLLKISIST